MHSSKPDPSAFPTPRGPWLITSFPWLILLTCWIVFFLMDNKMDAPLTSLEDRVVSDVAQQVSDGDIVHKILTVGLSFIGAFLLIRYRKRVRIYPAMAGLLTAYLVWISLGAVTAEDPSLTIRRLGGYALTLVLCAGLATRMDVDSNSAFLAAIPTLTILPDIVAELKSHGLEALTATGRFGGTYPHPNVAAAALAIPVIVFTWFTLRTRGVMRLGLAFLDLVIIAFFALTRSRTSILAVVAAIAFSLAIILVRNQRRNLGRLLGIVVLLTGLTGLGALLVNSGAHGLNLLGAVHSDRDEGDPTTLTGRVDLWKTCLEYVHERPLLGFGFGGFWSAKHIEAISAEQKWPINQSHSAYIDQALALGFPGAALYVLVLLAALFICTTRFFRYADGFGVWAGILVFIAVNSVTEAISLPPGFLSFVFSLLTVQIALIQTRTLDEPAGAETAAGGGFSTTTDFAMADSIHKYANQEDLLHVLAGANRRQMLKSAKGLDARRHAHQTQRSDRQSLGGKLDAKTGLHEFSGNSYKPSGDLLDSPERNQHL